MKVLINHNGISRNGSMPRKNKNYCPDCKQFVPGNHKQGSPECMKSAPKNGGR